MEQKWDKKGDRHRKGWVDFTENEQGDKTWPDQGGLWDTFKEIWLEVRWEGSFGEILRDVECPDLGFLKTALPIIQQTSYGERAEAENTLRSSQLTWGKKESLGPHGSGGDSHKPSNNGHIWKTNQHGFLTGFMWESKTMDLNNPKDWNGKENILYDWGPVHKFVPG